MVVGDYTYASIWNNDTTVDGTSTYRFTCMVCINLPILLEITICIYYLEFYSLGTVDIER